MTTSTNARKFSPIFAATITPASVSTRTDKNGAKYSVMTGATVVRGDKTETRTVMAFGNPREAVAKMLRKGKAVSLAVQFDGGVLKVIGLPIAKAANEG